MTQKRISMQQALGAGYNRFFHARNFYRVVKGSRGSKKSKNTALCYIHDLLKYPWANLLVVRRFSNTNKQSTYTDLKWAAERLGVLHLFQCNESMPEMTIKHTGQKILFRGLDDPLKITSIAVTHGVLSWAWFEEAYQIEDANKFDTVVESIRGSYDAPDFYKQITLTFNPWSERHWLKPTFFDEETSRADVFRLTTTYRVNEWLDDTDKRRYEELKITNPRRAKIVCDGDWGISEGLVFDRVETKPFSIPEIIKTASAICVGMDFGFTNDPTTIIQSALHLEEKKLYIFAEHYERAMTTGDIFQVLEDKDLLKATIIADCAEPRLIAELRNKGARRLQASVKGQDSIRHGIQYMREFEIIVHPSCEHVAEEFATYCYAKDREGNFLNKPEDKNNHTIDAIRYSLEPYHLNTQKKDLVEHARALRAYF